MKTKYLIVVGAGATRSDAGRTPEKNSPPLDKFFFKWSKNYPELSTISDYLNKTYDIDIFDSSRDSLETIMAIIYADIHNTELEHKAINAFRSLIELFNRRIADTTNHLKPNPRTNLYRIIKNALAYHKPEEICILTLNQDLHIEKTLDRLHKTKAINKKYGSVFSFPGCYGIHNANELLSNPQDDVNKFKISSIESEGIRILKLHGSLNWYRTHGKRKVTKNQILDQKSDFLITPRVSLIPELTYEGKSTFPLIVPPVTHKSGILHKGMNPLWKKASTALTAAAEIVVFGYSCPKMDFESANLIRRAIRQNKNIKYFSVIDPAPAVFQRYVDITGLNRVFWFRDADSFIKGYD